MLRSQTERIVTGGGRAQDGLVALLAEEGVILAVPAVNAKWQVLVVVVVGQPELRVAVGALKVPVVSPGWPYSGW